MIDESKNIIPELIKKRKTKTNIQQQKFIEMKNELRKRLVQTNYKRSQYSGVVGYGIVF